MFKNAKTAAMTAVYAYVLTQAGRGLYVLAKDSVELIKEKHAEKK